MNFDSSVLQIPIEDIIPNRFQPRRSFDDGSLQELADSIRQHGIIQPLVLRPNGDKYEIIAGERRYKASMMAGLASVPAVIARISDQQSAETSIVENVQRKPLTAIEEAQSYKALLDKGYMSQEDLAKRMGLSQGAISNKLRLLTLSDEVQNAVLENKISERHARSLLKIKNKTVQNEWLKRIITERLTVKQLDDLLKNVDLDSIPEDSVEEDTSNTNSTVDSTEKIDIENMAANLTVDDNSQDNIDSSDSFKLPDERPSVEPDNPFNKFLDMEIKEEIESLDFLPPNADLLQSDVKYLSNQVDSLLDRLRSNKHIQFNKNENESEITYTIIINKKDQDTL